MSLTGLDLAVITVPLLVVLAVALAMRRYLHSVADYLAASRCAGRYLISSAVGELGSSVMLTITALEVFSKTGFSLHFWNGFTTIVFFFCGLLGLIAYRFRETRALTFHQFFEARYSKGVRVLASVLNVLSGIFNFGIQPAVGSRFFVYFCGLPLQTSLLGVTIPTYVVLMVILMGMSIFLAMSGGQISVMVTDALEGVLSSIFYLVVAGFILLTVSVSQMRTALLSGPAGQSFVDPFDISAQQDFNGWYVILGLLLPLYWYRGNAWQQGFAAAAKTAHESRMAHILGNWRNYCSAAMATLISIGAFTLLHHPDFTAQRQTVEHGLQSLGDAQLQTQMRMPMALGVLLSSGVKGAFCAVALFGILAAQGAQLHSYGSTILQDVVLPLRRRPLSAAQHVWWLRACAVAVGSFACFFSIIYKPVDYLIMITMLIGVIYLGGVGVVVWGGLYWRRGTTQGAYTALIVGSTLAVVSTLVQQFWPRIAPTLAGWLGDGSLGLYVTAHLKSFPLNGRQLSLLSAASALISYVVVSLATCRKPFNLDAMLHRGIYRLDDEAPAAISTRRRAWYERIINVTEDFTRADRLLAYGTSLWTVLWKVVALGVLLWSLLVARPSAGWWFGYALVINVWLTLGVAAVVTVWFVCGVWRDLRDLFGTLGRVRRDDADDGTVPAGSPSATPADQAVAVKDR